MRGTSLKILRGSHQDLTQDSPFRRIKSGGGICCNSPPEMSPGEEDAHESRVGPDAHGAQREEDDAGGLVLGVALERRLCGNVRSEHEGKSR